MTASPSPPLPHAVLSLADRIVQANEADAKAKLYALALGSVFTIELGPLLTALLLAGRIGGSYAGEVSMMAATNQLDLFVIVAISLAGPCEYPRVLATRFLKLLLVPYSKNFTTRPRSE